MTHWDLFKYIKALFVYYVFKKCKSYYHQLKKKSNVQIILFEINYLVFIYMV